MYKIADILLQVLLGFLKIFWQVLCIGHQSNFFFVNRFFVRKVCKVYNVMIILTTGKTFLQVNYDIKKCCQKQFVNFQRS